MLIGLTGKAGSGKDTIAKYLVETHGFTRMAFADKLKELALQMDPDIPDAYTTLASLVARSGWEEAKEIPEVRRYLQNLGVSVRDVLGENTWVNQVFEHVDGHWISGRPDYVITDVRFPNELKETRLFNGVVWKVTGRSRLKGDLANHASEQELDGVEGVIDNSGPIEYTYEQVDELYYQLLEDQ